MTDFDLVIRSGTIADGTGSGTREADIAVKDGKIAAVGAVAGKGAEEIDAKGLLVTPGFVDIHTHYDGQATWDSRLQPSSWHGVTTAVMGNCGVGFAPVKIEDRQRLIELMEGVEDIPGAALDEGLNWSWESFGQYLDALEARPRDMDLGAQLPHGALRVFVMGERAARLEEATPGMSSTPSINSISRSRSCGRTGAKPTPQLPITAVVTPCQLDGCSRESQVAWPS